VASCEACGRPVALARPACAYCGAFLRPEDIPRPPEQGAEASERPPGSSEERELVSVEVNRREAREVADALGLTEWTADQIVRRGEEHFLGLHTVDESAALDERLGARGFRVFRVPEAEARRPPTCAVAGGWSGGVLVLRTECRAVREVRFEDLLLVVQGAIARSFQADGVRRVIQSLRLDEGYRFHLHSREAATPPVELDPDNFEFSPAGLSSSSLLEMRQWFEALPAGVLRDDAFRHRTPALAPAMATRSAAVGAMLGVRTGSPHDAAVVLDNLLQFREYSGWRAGVERRR